MIETDGYAAHLGLRLVDDPDRIVVRMTVGPEHVNFLGGTHGGAVFSLADCAFSLASNYAGDRAVAIDAHLVLTAGSGVGEVLTATAEEVNRSSHFGTYRITVRRSDGRVVGMFTGTVHISRPGGETR
jgi:acyl-CoA thioesterase